MSTAADTRTATPAADTRLLARILDEGHGPGAWHGNDMKAALADVEPALAFWRPASGRHNIAEIAVHHAYYIHSVRERLMGASPGPFAFQGDGDWFTLPESSRLEWPELRAIVDTEQQELRALIGEVGAGRVTSPLGDRERFDVILGITCHAVYHAGQVQLIKALNSR